MFSVTVAGASVSFLVPTKNDEKTAHEQLDHCLHDDPELAIHYNKQRNALRENAQSIPLSGKLVVRHDLPLYWAAAKVAWSVRKDRRPYFTEAVWVARIPGLLRRLHFLRAITEAGEHINIVSYPGFPPERFDEQSFTRFLKSHVTEIPDYVHNIRYSTKFPFPLSAEDTEALNKQRLDLDEAHNLLHNSTRQQRVVRLHAFVTDVLCLHKTQADIDTFIGIWALVQHLCQSGDEAQVIKGYLLTVAEHYKAAQTAQHGQLPVPEPSYPAEAPFPAAPALQANPAEQLAPEPITTLAAISAQPDPHHARVPDLRFLDADMLD